MSTTGRVSPQAHAAVSIASNVRNVAIVGPQSAGKTTLVEALLHRLNVTTRLGSVTDGTTVTDHLDVEKKLQHSVSLAVATAELNDKHLAGIEPTTVTFIDTPGNPDFVGEVRAALRAADSVLFVVSAVDGIDAVTAAAWRECAQAQMPRAVVVTHTDQPRGSFTDAVAAATEAFGEGVHPLYVPFESGTLSLLDNVVRVDGKDRPATEAEVAQYAELRAAAIEAALTDGDDEELLERYLSGEDVDFAALAHDINVAISHSEYYPVLAVEPLSGRGLTALLELIAKALPTPTQHHMPAVYTIQGADAPALSGQVDGPMVAEVIKTNTDQYVGRMSVVRVFSGTLKPDMPVHISGHLAQFTGIEGDEEWHRSHDVDAKVGNLALVQGATLVPIESAPAGAIVAITHVDVAETGDTLSDPESPVIVEPWTFPHPLLPTAIRAQAVKDEDKLMRGLARLQAEHPTAQVVMDPETNQLVLWTMGDSQLQLLLASLRERERIEVDVEDVRVAVHETVRASATGVGRHVKQSGGHGQYAVVNVTVEPLAEGAGFEFVDEVVGGVVPRQFIGSVEKGIRDQMVKGVTGFPMVDIRVRLTGGKAHSVDSSDAAFQSAGAAGLREAAKAAGIQLLEPVDEARITVDDEFVGAIMSDLASRRGRVRTTDSAGTGRTVVIAEVPAFEMVRYATVLRSLAHGSGEFERKHVKYWPAPAAVQERLSAK